MPLRHPNTLACLVATFVANAAEQLIAKTEVAASQPIAAELQPLQGTWVGGVVDDEIPKTPAPQESGKRKLGEVDLDFLRPGVLGSQHKSPENLTVTVTGNLFYFHRDTNFWFETTIALPAGTNPKQLHATIKSCPPSQASSIGKMVVAIFKIEDGTLTLATGNGDGGAPKSFEGTRDNGLNRYELREVQPQKKNGEPPKTK